MPTYLLYRKHNQPGNATGHNAVIAGGANEAAARTAAAAALPDGETKVNAAWAAKTLAATDTLATPIWIQGEVSTPEQRSRGQ